MANPQTPTSSAPRDPKGVPDLRPRKQEADFDFEVPEGDEVDDGCEDVINISGQPARFNIGQTPIILKPGQSTRVLRAYTAEVAGAGQQGDTLPPVVMRLTDNRVVPASHKMARGHVVNKAATIVAPPKQT